MSTIYTWAAEQAADTTGAGGDWTLVYDTSTGRTKKAAISSVFLGRGPETVMGFYGETGVNQGTMTATAITALVATVTTTATNPAAWCWSNSTLANTYVKRLAQIQVDLETLMGKIDSTGLVAIAGVP